MSRTAWACLLLAGLTVAVYWPVSDYAFVSYDDPVYVLENTHVRTGLGPANIRWVFTSTENSNWHPLTWISHMIDCRLFGVHYPGAHHVTNLLLHAVNSLLMFLMLRQMTGSFWRPLFIASIFSLHPHSTRFHSRFAR